MIFGRKPRRAEPEFLMQSAVITWSRNAAVRRQYPELALLSASLNGVKLSKAQAGKAKAAGMLTGEHDLRLPVARGGYIGLSIELKAGKNRPTDEQIEHGARLTAEGWKVVYIWDDWLDVRDAIVEYLNAGRTGEQHGRAA